MEQNNRNVLVGITLLILIVAGVFLWKSRMGASHELNTLVDTIGSISSTTPPSTTTITNSTSSGASTNGGVSIIPPKSGNISTPAPSLSRPLPDTSKIDQSLVVRMQAEIQIHTEKLKVDPTSFGDWIDLGLARKTLGDYAGAAEIWEYVSLLYPQNIISFANLGDLYTSFIQNYPKAEANYTAAIKNDSTNVDLYRNLFNLYHVQGKNTEAVAVLEKGIKAKKALPDLQIMLAHYYRDAGNTVQAKAYYDQAISVATAQGKTELAATLTAEKNQVQ